MKIADEKSSMSSFRRLFHGGDSPNKSNGLLETPVRKSPLKSAIKPSTPLGVSHSSQALSVHYLMDEAVNNFNVGIPETTLTMALQKESVGLRQGL